MFTGQHRTRVSIQTRARLPGFGSSSAIYQLGDFPSLCLYFPISLYSTTVRMESLGLTKSLTQSLDLRKRPTSQHSQLAPSQVKRSPEGQGQRGQNHERVILEQTPRMEREPKGGHHPSSSYGHCRKVSESHRSTSLLPIQVTALLQLSVRTVLNGVSLINDGTL